VGLSLNGQPGLFVAFDSGILHEVKSVMAGERLTVVSWFLGEEPQGSKESSDPQKMM
jgi:predicted 2-oxoglutarate/Fe(II)-dependent dioxygenase YbiX